MGKLLLLSVLLGLDNLRATIALGIAGVDAGARRRFALSFGLAEAMAPVVGVALGAAFALGPWMRPLAPAALVVCAGLSLGGVVWGHRASRWLGGGVTIVALPALLAVDNLAAGVGLARTGTVLMAAATGAASALWSLAGLEVGALTRRLLVRRPTGAALAMVVAATLLLVGVVAS
jgi:manganese efflux pump family protein